MPKTKAATPQWTDNDAAYIYRFEAGGKIREFVILGPRGHEETAGVCSCLFLESVRRDAMPDLLIRSTSKQIRARRFMKRA